jgi:catechol 2,3-dioxygenase-like lactoylglutathione lyase family enzyme
VRLRHAPLLYVFYETRVLERQRQLLETILGLPVIEVDPRQPRHRHGVVKYDGGTLVISLNLSTARRFRQDSSDALVAVFDIDPAWGVAERLGSGDHGLFTDAHGHHYVVRPAATCGQAGPVPPRIAELRLRVEDLTASVRFYRDVLGLELLGQTAGIARLATGTIPLVLERGPEAVDGRKSRYDTYLLVFHTADIEATRASLAAKGLTFSSGNVGTREIGATIRFNDPSGHRFCLYKPSAESLTWGSGPRVKEIVAGSSSRALVELE